MVEIYEEGITFDDHFVSFQDENYDSGGKRLKIERVQLSNINFVAHVEMNVDLSLVSMLALMKLHQASG